MPNSSIGLAVIIGSTRVGRFAPTVARWFVGQATEREDVAVDVIDLAHTQLPDQLRAFEPTSCPEVAAVAPRLAAADAFVIVTPEYNHSFPAPLKCAIDWFYEEWNAKPVGFVSYGGYGGGLRAVEHLRHVFAELHAVTVRDSISLHNVASLFDVDGNLKDPEPHDKAAEVLIDRLVWWGTALSEARSKRPYRV